MGHDNFNNAVGVIIKKLSQRKLRYLIYLFINGTGGIFLLIYSLYNMAIIIPHIAELSMVGIVQMISMLFIATWSAGILLSCVGVYYRRQWGRLMVIIMCSIGVAMNAISLMMQAYVGIGFISFVSVGSLMGCLVWIILFKSRYDFMQGDALRTALIDHYRKVIDRCNRRCIECENWSGGRKEADMKYDAQCEHDNEYHKGSYSCEIFFPAL